jgi:hypothetical protein
MADKIKYTSQYIDNMSFDEGLEVKIVEIIGADGVLKNPATEEKQDTANANLREIQDTLYWLRRISKQLEPSASADSNNRQRVSVDNSPSVLGYYSLAAQGANYPNIGAPANSGSTTYWHPVWEGPVDQRWRIADAARNSYANGVRNNLIFS